MEIRYANVRDLDAVASVEAECFPPAEAAARESLEERLRHYPMHFWLMFDGEKLVSFVDGMASDRRDLTDDMYDDASLHNERGVWQMIFGVNTIPAYRRQGCAGMLLERVIEDAKKQGRRGVVLTCKENLVHYYAKFGFVNEGISESAHGGAVWYKMRLTL